VVTGESAAYNEDVTPKRPFNLAEGHWGALQLVGRFMELNVDQDAFPRYSDPTTSARSAAAWSVGINWYLNRNILWKTSFSHTVFDGGGGPGTTAPATTTRKNESVLFTRLQLAF
jgi:phosphate-selective porin OprO/OprP